MTFRPLHDRVVVRLVEDEEKKDRVPDAIHVTKAAVAKRKTDNPDMKVGIKIVERALKAPIRQIAGGNGGGGRRGRQGGAPDSTPGGASS
jgi:co-chaperonin GroES (HSP10)